MAWNCKMCGKQLDDSEGDCTYCGNPQNPENGSDGAREYDSYEDGLDEKELEEFKKLERDTNKFISQIIPWLWIIGILILLVEIGVLIS